VVPFIARNEAGEATGMALKVAEEGPKDWSDDVGLEWALIAGARSRPDILTKRIFGRYYEGIMKEV